MRPFAWDIVFDAINGLWYNFGAMQKAIKNAKGLDSSCI